MSEFKSRWQDWQPKTATPQADKTDKTPQMGKYSSSVSFVSSLTGHFPESGEEVLSADSGSACLVCQKPISPGSGISVSQKDAHNGRIHLGCYDEWFEGTFGLKPTYGRA